MLAPGNLADVRVEVVVPPLAALLAGPPGELGGDAAPLLRTDLPHQLRHARVVLGGPGPLGTTVEHLGPAVEALHVGLTGDALRHLRDGGRGETRQTGDVEQISTRVGVDRDQRQRALHEGRLLRAG